MLERLQKRMAEAGIASRRASEVLIQQGKVQVNGKVVTEMGTKVSEKDVITVNGKTIGEKETKQYFVMNKPRGILCTTDDPVGRKTILDLLPEELSGYRLYSVGRLDYDTKGVILLTNDGTFMNEMVGPRSGIQKEYLVRIRGSLTQNEIDMLETGIKLEDKLTLPAFLEVMSIDEKNDSSLVRIIITQGLYHQVKEMFQFVGHEVKKLTRIRFGNITIDNLQEGEIRKLTVHEVRSLSQLAKADKNLTKQNYR
jgi:23S rRNA pseudouridine2605 synthase